MATGTDIRTWFEGRWHDGDVPVMRAADHGAWLGSGVFDGARAVDGLVPDLAAHCARANRSATAMGLNPTVSTDKMVAITHEGLAAYPRQTAVYIRPMYWARTGDVTAIVPDADDVAFCLCLEAIPMPSPDAPATLTTTRFRRPVIEDAVVGAKAGCLYPNNARMIAEARSRGFTNALVADAMGNVAESATSNVFIVRDGAVLTPIPNGTFLAGITRARTIANLAADGLPVTQTVLTFDDVREADEVFLTGNMAKVTPVTAFDDRHYQVGPVARRARDLYWEWARADAAKAGGGRAA